MGIIQDYVGWEDSPDIDVKVNTIVDFWSNPCNAPYSVYIETLYPALGRMFLVIIDTSLLDIARSYLRPREGLTRGHNRKKGRRRGRIPRIPDTADMFARMIPGAKAFEGMEYGANTKFLWQVDGIIQRGLWYIVFVDATTEGLYYWAQGIKEEKFCQPTNRPGIFLTNPSPFATAFFGLWFPSPGWSISWQEPGYDWFFTDLTVPEGRHEFAYRAEYVNDGDAWGRVEVRLKGAGAENQGSVIVPPREGRTLTFGGGLRGPARYVLEQRCFGTPFIDGENGIISVQKA